MKEAEAGCMVLGFMTLVLGFVSGAQEDASGGQVTLWSVPMVCFYLSAWCWARMFGVSAKSWVRRSIVTAMAMCAMVAVLILASIQQESGGEIVHCSGEEPALTVDTSPITLLGTDVTYKEFAKIASERFPKTTELGIGAMYAAFVRWSGKAEDLERFLGLVRTKNLPARMRKKQSSAQEGG